MKYFKAEIWEMFNSGSEELRIKGDMLWQKATVDYSNYFKTIKCLFSKKFLNIFTLNMQFHDARIDEISIRNTGKNFCDILFNL